MFPLGRTWVSQRRNPPTAYLGVLHFPPHVVSGLAAQISDATSSW